MKPIVVLASVLGGGIGGYGFGHWWLNRTVAAPELETAVYPGIGTIAGCIVGLALGLLVASRINRSDRSRRHN